MYPDQARRIFGAAPVTRSNPVELGFILGAREILATAPHQLPIENDDALLDRVRAERDALTDEQKAIAEDFLRAANQEEIVRSLARKIIEKAVGLS